MFLFNFRDFSIKMKFKTNIDILQFKLLSIVDIINNFTTEIYQCHISLRYKVNSKLFYV